MGGREVNGDSEKYLPAKGDQVLVRRAGDVNWTPAGVWLASDNHRSVALALQGMVRTGDGMVGGALPLLYHPETGVYEGVFTDDEYEVKHDGNH